LDTTPKCCTALVGTNTSLRTLSKRRSLTVSERQPTTPTGTLLLNVWNEHNHYVHDRPDPALSDQFAQIEAEARRSAIEAAMTLVEGLPYEFGNGAYRTAALLALAALLRDQPV
jgi:hypothetical protein